MTDLPQNFGRAHASSPPSDQAYQDVPAESDVVGALEAQWTGEQIYNTFGQMSRKYWRNCGLTMPDNVEQLPSYASAGHLATAATIVSTSELAGTQVGEVPTRHIAGVVRYSADTSREQQPQEFQLQHLQYEQQLAANSAAATPYTLLPQRQYVAKRRYTPQSAIVFRTETEGFVSLQDAMNGNLAGLLDGDVPVFSTDNLSQKQSIRLEVRTQSDFRRRRAGLGTDTIMSTHEDDGCSAGCRREVVRAPDQRAQPGQPHTVSYAQQACGEDC